MEVNFSSGFIVVPRRRGENTEHFRQYALVFISRHYVLFCYIVIKIIMSAELLFNTKKVNQKKKIQAGEEMFCQLMK